MWAATPARSSNWSRSASVIGDTPIAAASSSNQLAFVAHRGSVQTEVRTDCGAEGFGHVATVGDEVVDQGQNRDVAAGRYAGSIGQDRERVRHRQWAHSMCPLLARRTHVHPPVGPGRADGRYDVQSSITVTDQAFVADGLDARAIELTAAGHLPECRSHHELETDRSCGRVSG